MPSTFDLVTKFQPILDEIYKRESLTARMDAKTKPVDFGGAKTVKVFKTTMVGMGTYDRATGFPPGDVTGSWEELILTKDRGRAFSVDAMDDEETLGMGFGTLVGEFLRTRVVPEIDAYRFSVYATGAGTTPTQANLTSSTNVLKAIDVAAAKLDELEVPNTGRLLFCSNAIYHLLKGSLTRSWASEGVVSRDIATLDNMEVIMVPQTRFYKGITLDAGSSTSAGGYKKTDTSGRDINFLLLHPSAVLQVAKHNPLRIFPPAVNQTADAWLFQYRIYHDAFIYDNKDDGIYAHIATS